MEIIGLLASRRAMLQEGVRSLLDHGPELGSAPTWLGSGGLTDIARRTSLYPYLGGITVLSAVAASALGPGTTEVLARSGARDQPARTKQAVIKPVHAQMCTKRIQALFSLTGPSSVTTGHATDFRLTVKNCKGDSQRLEHIKLVESHAPGPKKRTRYVIPFEPGIHKHQALRLSFLIPKDDETSRQSRQVRQKPKIVVKAYGPNGKRIGSSQWNLGYMTVAQGAKQCSPHPDFKFGFQDDREVIGEEHMTTEMALDLMSSTLGATALRINMFPAQVEAYGLDSYIYAIDIANARGFETLITLMPNPSYVPSSNQVLSFRNLDADLMRSFARKVATTLGPRVMHYSIGNEPNHHLFSNFYQKENIDVYLREARAGRQGVLDGNPRAKVQVGELAAGPNLAYWIKAMSKLPNDGVAIHPYGPDIHHLKAYIRMAGGSLNVTEDGVFAAAPNQVAEAADRLRVARCSGVSRYILYTPFDYPDPLSGWDMGFVTRHGNNRVAHKAYLAAMH